MYYGVKMAVLKGRLLRKTCMHHAWNKMNESYNEIKHVLLFCHLQCNLGKKILFITSVTAFDIL